MTVTATMPDSLVEVAATAAAAAAAVIPATSPLAALPAEPDDLPPDEAVAHVVTHLGAKTVEIALVAEAAVAEAVEAGNAGPNAGLTAADILRPALEAAAEAFGPGTIDDPRAVPAADIIGADTAVFALAGEGGTVAWFTVRLCRQPMSASSAVANNNTADRVGLRLLYGVDMTLTAEIGRARLPVRQVLDLLPGSLLELDRTAGAPADVVVNGRLIARGEVVVVDESYAIRITEIAQGTDLS